MPQPPFDSVRAFDPKRLSNFELGPEQSRVLLTSFLASLGPDFERLRQAWQVCVDAFAKVNARQALRATQGLSEQPLNKPPAMRECMQNAMEAAHHFKGLVGLFATPPLLKDVNTLEQSILRLKEAESMDVIHVQALTEQLQALGRQTERLKHQAQVHLDVHLPACKGSAQ